MKLNLNEKKKSTNELMLNLGEDDEEDEDDELEEEEDDIIEKDNNILNLIKDEKIKIKNPFIIFSKSNYSIFDIDNADKKNIYDMRKSKEQIIHLINTFRDLVNFMFIYLQIIATKIEKIQLIQSMININKII